MTRLIDADELIKKANFQPLAPYILKRDVDDAPTVDAEPVRHGRWTYLNCFEKGRYQCRECGHFIDAGVDMNYCPNCGAKMNGDGNADN